LGAGGVFVGGIMSVYLKDKKPWGTLKKRGYSVYSAGVSLPWSQIYKALTDKDFKAVSSILNAVTGNYAFIIETAGFVFAAVDHIASTPVFYTHTAVSNCARQLQRAGRLYDVHDKALQDFLMAGYTTGAQTVYRGLSMVQAGQGVYIENGEVPELISHFEYLPTRILHSDLDKAQVALGGVLDDIFADLVRDLDGRQVLLPLSGGLDSRLVLTKLLEHGHSNILAFSYGTKGNREAEIARDVAKILGVTWLDLPSRNASKLAKTRQFKEFERAVDGLSIVPSYLDYEALTELKARDDVSDDAVIINGQTGDFIAGAHIPHDLLSSNATFDEAVQAIARVHYRQRADMTPNLQDVAAQVKHLGDVPAYGVFEYWEWQERQAKAVMVGQRGYDFFGYDWRLPLWDKRLVDFFATIPPELKKDRGLMVEYLTSYDPKSVFTKTYPEIGTWPKGRGGIQWIARACGLVGGQEFKDKCYGVLHYFSNYHNQFAVWGFGQYLQNKKYTKRFVGQSAIFWKNRHVEPKMQLVISKFLPEYTGAAFRVGALYKRLGFGSVSVLCNSTSQKTSQKYEINNFDAFRIVFPFSWGCAPRRLVFAIKTYYEFIFSFLALLISKKPQLLHIVGYSGATMAALLYGRLFAVPRLIELVTAQATPFQYLPGLRYPKALGLERNTAIVAISKNIRDNLEKDNIINPVWCRPNPINGRKFSLVSAAEKAKLRSQISPFKKADIVIAQVAKFMPQKNQIFMLDVLKELPESYKLLLAGPRAETGLYEARDREYFQDIENKITEYGLQDRVHIQTGFVEAADYMRASDMYVMPQHSEGLGTPMLEAIACGLPVIANADELAFQEWVKTGKNGALAPLDAKKWAAAVKKAQKFSKEQRKTASDDIRALASVEDCDAKYRLLMEALCVMEKGEELDIADVF
jgi:asparagine synthase (glutamine-hydrolysing)